MFASSKGRIDDVRMNGDYMGLAKLMLMKFKCQMEI
jgi:hypothetical protein